MEFGENEARLLKNATPKLLSIIEKRSDEIRRSDLSDYKGILNLIFATVFDEPVYEVYAIIMKFINDTNLYSEKIRSMNLEAQFLERINEELGTTCSKFQDIRLDVTRAIFFRWVKA